MSTNAKELYERIKANPEQTQALFRQALQDPQGAIQAICELGEAIGLSVTPSEVKEHLQSMNDGDTKQWILKARGGL